jgi:hypothetical protein
VEQFEQTRLQRNQAGMLILGSWAVGNLAVSPLLARRSEGSQKYFHQMNGYWNVVNLTLAGVGYIGVRAAMGAEPTWTSMLHEQVVLEKILLVNAALDAGYIVGGLYLKERGKNSENHADRLTGFGNSLLLQGGFLLLFDVGFYAVVHQNYNQIFDWLQNFQLTTQGAGLKITYRF